MTVSGGYKDQYYGDGSTATFNTTFQFQNASEVLVTILSIDGLTESTKVLNSNYDVTGGAGSTGAVVFRAGNIPAGTGGAGTSERITLSRNMPLTQQLDLTPNDPFPAQSVELSLGDRMIMIAQQLQEQISRSAKLKLSTSLSSGPFFDDPADGRVPIYNLARNTYENGPNATEVENAQTYSVQALSYKNDAQAAAAAATAAAAGMKFRSVRTATTANITLSAPQTIDGVSVIAGERVLVKNQSAPAENGIYVVAAGAWTRSTDMDAWTEVTGSVVVVEEGSTLADTAWLCTANQGGTLGVTAINFIDWGQVILGGGIALAKLAVQAANTIVANASGSSASPTAVAIAANRFLARSSTGDLAAKTITDFALSLLDDADAAAAKATLGIVDPAVPFSHISGFIPSSIAGTNTTASMTVSAGQAADSANAKFISKATTTSWAVSNGNALNGYQGGTTLPNSSTIHMYAIEDSAGANQGVFASTSLTPTLPSSHTGGKYRRIFSFQTTGAGAPIPYTAIEAEGGSMVAWLATRVLDFNSTVGTSRSLVTLSIPSGVKHQPFVRAASTASSFSCIIMDSPDETDVAPQTAAAGGYNGVQPGWDFTSSTTYRGGIAASPYLTTNTSGQIAMRSTAAGAAVELVTRGFKDFRR